VRRTPVVLDGSATTVAAAVLADRLAPGAARWWLPGQVPAAPAARDGLADLGLTGLLDLELADPLGAELAWSVLARALDLVQPRA
jgi:nicotinate-nucleotide--dimethylbenzimidazole phosphoribosyltransferase